MPREKKPIFCKSFGISFKFDSVCKNFVFYPKNKKQRTSIVKGNCHGFKYLPSIYIFYHMHVHNLL